MKREALRARRVPKRAEGASASASSPRDRVLQVALRLLAQGGRDALTTRAVAEAAGMQPPALYRLFQDKRGLLDALSDYGYALYFSEKRSAKHGEDPVQFLRDGWERHVNFGLSHPELYLLMYANPNPSAETQSGRHAHEGLRTHMRALAVLGRLRVSEDLATDMFHAAACGVVLSLLAVPKGARDLTLSTTTCDATLAAMLLEKPIRAAAQIPASAVALRAQLLQDPRAGGLTSGEKTLLFEWLIKLSRS